MLLIYLRMRLTRKKSWSGDIINPYSNKAEPIKIYSFLGMVFFVFLLYSHLDLQFKF